MKMFLFAAAAMALIGTLPLDGSYYEILRLVLAAAGVTVMVKAISAKHAVWAVAGGIIFFLWFPGFEVYLDKDTWVVLDLLAAIALVIFARVSSRLVRPNDPKE